MSFIKLNRDNFENTRIKNNFNVKFEKNDPNSYISDNNFNTKSLVYCKEITYDSIDHSLLNIENVESVKTDVASFFNTTFDETSSFNEIYLSKKNLVENHSIDNHNLKSFNFKNFFDIKRENQKNIIDSFSLAKLNTVKNSLYDYYDKDMSKDYYPEINFGFCNYNSLNLFSQKSESIKSHTNCIVYSNQYDVQNQKNEIDFKSDFTLNFWLNIRKDSNNLRSCILHVPEVLSIYVIERESRYYFCVTTGDDANKLVNNENFIGVNFLSDQNQLTDGCYLLAENSFEYNNWYNINFSFFKNSSDSNNYLLKVHSDNIEIHSIDIVIDAITPKNYNSYICIGNKPEYYQESTNSYNTSYEEIFYTFFGKKNQEDFDGPFYKKDINLGTNVSYNDTNIGKNIETILTDGDNIVFNDEDEISSAFSGEISDIKIYDKTLSSDNIEYLSKNNISSLEDHKNIGLKLYVPMFYLPLFVKKEGLFNNSISDANIYYSNIYNPYYANTCGGLDISIENYLVDFINYKKPNVIINGFDINNIFDNKTNIFEQALVDDYQKIKKGEFSADISIEKIESNITNDVDLDLSLGSNFYRNLLILPCDNGIPNIKFDIISEALSSNTVSYQNIDTNKLYNVSCENCLTGFENVSRKYKLVTSNPAASYEISVDSEIFNVNNSIDGFYNISNFVYHDERLLSQNDVLTSNLNLEIDKSLDSLLKIVKTKSNPATRIYNDAVLRIDKSILEEDITYKDLPIPYFDFNASSLNMFSVIYDLSKSYYNIKIKKKSFSIEDSNIIGTNNQLGIKISDDGNGILYRNNCLTKVAKWNYVGNIFYSEGILCINNPSLYYFGKRNFKIDMTAHSNLYIHETNVIINQGLVNNSTNATYDRNLRIDESSFNSDEPFVYISDVNLHDENLNVVAKARLAHPIPKKNTDNILIKLKMDY